MLIVGKNELSMTLSFLQRLPHDGVPWLNCGEFVTAISLILAFSPFQIAMIISKGEDVKALVTNQIHVLTTAVQIIIKESTTMHHHHTVNRRSREVISRGHLSIHRDHRIRIIHKVEITVVTLNGAHNEAVIKGIIIREVVIKEINEADIRGLTRSNHSVILLQDPTRRQVSRTTMEDPTVVNKNCKFEHFFTYKNWII